MKVVHISTSDRMGGAAIAAYRLNEAMRAMGMDSKMLVANKVSDENSVFSLADLKGKQYKFIYELVHSFSFHLKQCLLKPYGIFSLGAFFSYRISCLSMIKDADVIYVHWTNDAFIGIREINRLLRLGKPVFFFMHDMWLITGGCHHSFACNQWRNKCKLCPNIQRKSMQCISQYVFDKKKKLLPMHIITPSKWLSDCVRNSALFSNSEVVTIPNLLNTRIFRLIDKQVARAILGLPFEKKLILFAAAGGSTNIYKGWNIIERISNSLSKEEIGIVLMGNRLSDSSKFSLPIYSMGRLHDEYSLALLYNAVDVYLSPTMAESFGMTLVEAQACGTPVVAFNVGGVPDTMVHKLTGYLAELGNEIDLLQGIEWAFGNIDNRKWREMSHARVERLYSYQEIVKSHIVNFNKFNNV